MGASLVERMSELLDNQVIESCKYNSGIHPHKSVG